MKRLYHISKEGIANPHNYNNIKTNTNKTGALSIWQWAILCMVSDVAEIVGAKMGMAPNFLTRLATMTMHH